MILTVRTNKLIIFVFFLISTVLFYISLRNRPSISCYNERGPFLPSILSDSSIKNQSIFFHETSCKSSKYGKIVISARQACSVESAAKFNPNFNVYLLYTSPGIIKNEGNDSDRFINALLSYKNIKFRHVDYGKYLEDTPVEALWKSGMIERSNHFDSHASDVLRFVTLWRYGGIYLDLDVIVKKSFNDLISNFGAVESEMFIGSAVMGFSRNRIGYDIVTECLNYLKLNFNGREWAANGPAVITEIAKKQCNVETEDIRTLAGKNCNGFQVYPEELFYPLPWWNWTMFFDENQWNQVEKLIEKSYVIHIWNKMSNQEIIPVKSNVPYAKLAREYCPNVFNQCTDFF